jgi:cytochrome c oxidase subunit IV
MNTQMQRTLAMWRGPLLVWLILMLLVVLTYSAAVSALPGAWKTVIHFVVVAIQVTLIGVFFMDLSRAQGLQRLAAVAGLYWLAIMFVLAFNDYQSRPLSSPCDVPAFTAASDQCASPVR